MHYIASQFRYIAPSHFSEKQLIITDRLNSACILTGMKWPIRVITLNHRRKSDIFQFYLFSDLKNVSCAMLLNGSTSDGLISSDGNVCFILHSGQNYDKTIP